MCIAKEKLVAKNNATKKSESVKKNWTNLFTKPLKPKLPRQIIKSTKLNLNRYWAKFEELMGAEEEPLNNHLPLIEPEFIPNNQQPQQPILNLQNIRTEDLANYMAKQHFFVEKNFNRSGRYKYFYDESLYHGVNLANGPQYQQQQQMERYFDPYSIYDNNRLQSCCCSCCQTPVEPIYENLYVPQVPVPMPNINWTFQG